MRAVWVWTVALLATIASASMRSRGWGDDIAWTTADRIGDGLKPSMVIIHKSWSGACKHLKPLVASNAEITALSRQFHMVNFEDEEEPQEERFHPDGDYIPRILFFDKSGRVDMSVRNTKGSKKYVHMYFDAKGIVASMKDALRKHSPDSFSDEL